MKQHAKIVHNMHVCFEAFDNIKEKSLFKIQNSKKQIKYFLDIRAVRPIRVRLGKYTEDVSKQIHRPTAKSLVQNTHALTIWQRRQ